MTDKEIIAVWYQTPAHSIVEFARALLKAERDACIEACDAVDRDLVGAMSSYMDGQIRGVQRCKAQIEARNDLPTRE